MKKDSTTSSGPADESRTTLVVGACGEIGSAICRRLAQDGHHVIVSYSRSKERAEALLLELHAAGGTGRGLALDVRRGPEVKETLLALLQDCAVDTLVYAAGITRDAVFPSLREEDWNDVVATNLTGFFHVCQPLVMPMVARRFGRIIAISSLAGTRGNRGQANYAAAKSGLHGAVRSLALEVAKKGVTVNAIAPGFIETALVPPDVREVQKAIIPMRRLGRPDEVAGVTAFLAHSDASYITGQVIEVSGGL